MPPAISDCEELTIPTPDGILLQAEIHPQLDPYIRNDVFAVLAHPRGGGGGGGGVRGQGNVDEGFDNP